MIGGGIPLLYSCLNVKIGIAPLTRSLRLAKTSFIFDLKDFVFILGESFIVRAILALSQRKVVYYLLFALL